jgi:PST family polysaccharide transporter
VAIVFGEKWRAAGPVLSVFACGGVLFSVSYFNAPLMLASGLANRVFGLIVLNAMCNLTGFLLAVPFGATAVAAAFVLRGYLVYPVNLWLLRNTCGLSVRQYARALWPAAVASTLAALAAYLCTSLAGPHGLATQGLATDWLPIQRLGIAWVLGGSIYALTIAGLFRDEAQAALNEVRAMVQATRSGDARQPLEASK